MVIPHSLYNVGKNKGFIHLNTSHDTSELACDSLAAWWDQQGRADYPQAQKLLVLCDGGGSNSATMYLFKEDLQKLASRLGIEIRVAHYPPYCSKYNRIEEQPPVPAFGPGACRRSDLPHPGDRSDTTWPRPKRPPRMRVKVSILEDRCTPPAASSAARGFEKAMKIVFGQLPAPNGTIQPLPEPV